MFYSLYLESIRQVRVVAAIVTSQQGQCVEERHEAQTGRKDRAQGRRCGTQEDAPFLQNCVRYTKFAAGCQYLWFG